MIQIGTIVIDLNDPLTQLALAGGVVLLLVLILLIMAVRRAGEATRNIAPMVQSLSSLQGRVETLADGQSALSGGLTQVSEAAAASQSNMLKLMEARLSEVSKGMQDNLANSATKTARSLGELQQRLQTIDKAQANIEKLSGDVLTLQDILSNKQTRGAFGEIQLYDILEKALPSDSYSKQVTLSNNRRADCLVHLPNPPGPIVIDAKFPLEAYEALRNASNDYEVNEAAKLLRASVKKHIKDISEKYILDGETADGALMFLPSEAVYAELHANFPELVREGFEKRVWIVSPTTCMATLNTMRAILKDARMREQAGAIRKALKHLHRDVEIIGERAAKLETHFNQARADIEGLGVASERAGKRAARLDNFDFEELAPETSPEIVRLAQAKAQDG
ncbi:MAG: DNA recombination protein RmuC [Pseudomonadota bacterium]